MFWFKRKISLLSWMTTAISTHLLLRGRNSEDLDKFKWNEVSKRWTNDQKSFAMISLSIRCWLKITALLMETNYRLQGSYQGHRKMLSHTSLNGIYPLRGDKCLPSQIITNKIVVAHKSFVANSHLVRSCDVDKKSQCSKENHHI